MSSQVYAYLKRLGYIVTRADPPSSDYPIPSPHPRITRAHASFLGKLCGALSSALARVARIFTNGLDWWRPMRRSHWLHHNTSNCEAFPHCGEYLLTSWISIIVQITSVSTLRTQYSTAYPSYR